MREAWDGTLGQGPTGNNTRPGEWPIRRSAEEKAPKRRRIALRRRRK